MFTLNRQKLKLVHVNPRKELHGEEHVLAADLGFMLVTGNDVLAEFHPTLRAALYEKNESDMADQAGASITKLRFPDMGPVKWKGQQKGMQLEFFAPTAKPNAEPTLSFGDVPVDKFAIECKDGGSVVITFRAQVHPSSVSMLGKLCDDIQEEVVVSLIEPTDTPPA